MRSVETLTSEISDISEKRDQIVTEIKELLGNNAESFKINIGDIMNFTKNEQHLVALEKAKKVCNELINKIMNMEITKEERDVLRTRLSSNVRKVRDIINAIEEKDLTEEAKKVFNKEELTKNFNEEVSNVRGQISELVRAEKRKEKMQEITDFLKDLKDKKPSQEEMKKIRTGLKNEIAWLKRTEERRNKVSEMAETGEIENKEEIVAQRENEKNKKNEPSEEKSALQKTLVKPAEKTDDYSEGRDAWKAFVQEHNKIEPEKSTGHKIEETINEILKCSDKINKNEKIREVIELCKIYRKERRSKREIANLNFGENIERVNTEEIVQLVSRLAVSEKEGREPLDIKSRIEYIKSYSEKIREIKEDSSPLFSEDSWEQSVIEEFRKAYTERKNEIQSNLFSDSITEVKNKIVESGKKIIAQLHKTKGNMGNKGKRGTFEEPSLT